MTLRFPAESAERGTDTDVAPELHPTLRLLHGMSVRGLRRMFDPTERMFVFRVEPSGGDIVQKGISVRYTAITLCGMARVSAAEHAEILGSVSIEQVWEELRKRAVVSDNLGDVALALLAGIELGADDCGPVVERLKVLDPVDRPHPLVEVSWSLAALATMRRPDLNPLRDQLAQRLIASYHQQSKLFPHMLGVTNSRSHVSCYADLVYPIHALSLHSMATGDRQSLAVASAAGANLCELQGPDGQWWWHYDYRSGAVLEKYPVYAIHQDAMGPMALLTLKDAGGPDSRRAIERGLQWLVSAPELGGGSLIDSKADLIWRKVARREPRKAVRYIQATAALVHPSLRMPAVDALFPAQVIDFEDRPYHLGWFFYAWANRPVLKGGRS